jgi:hypothetical protein
VHPHLAWLHPCLTWSCPGCIGMACCVGVVCVGVLHCCAALACCIGVSCCVGVSCWHGSCGCLGSGCFVGYHCALNEGPARIIKSTLVKRFESSAKRAAFTALFVLLYLQFRKKHTLYDHTHTLLWVCGHLCLPV